MVGLNKVEQECCCKRISNEKITSKLFFFLFIESYTNVPR